MRLSETVQYTECHLIFGWSLCFPRLWRLLTYLRLWAGLSMVFMISEISLYSCYEGIKVAENGFVLQISFTAIVLDKHLLVNTVHWKHHLNSLREKILICLVIFLLVVWEERAVMNLPCPSFKIAKQGRCENCVFQTLMQESIKK